MRICSNPATGIRTTADSPRPGRAKQRANVDTLQATPSDARRLSRLVKCPLSDAQRRPEHDWGSRGRRFKSGRPNWSLIFFEYSYSTQEPTKEPSCCATALLETCPDAVPRRPYGHVPTRQSRLRPTVTESKITEPPPICAATPPTANGRRQPRPPAAAHNKLPIRRYLQDGEIGTVGRAELSVRVPVRWRV